MNLKENKPLDLTSYLTEFKIEHEMFSQLDLVDFIDQKNSQMIINKKCEDEIKNNMQQKETKKNIK